MRMFKRFALVTLSLPLLWPLFSPAALASSPKLKSVRSQITVALLYHSGFTNEQVDMRSLYNLIGHFTSEITPLDVDAAPSSAARQALLRTNHIVYLANKTATDRLSTRWLSIIRQNHADLYDIGGNLSMFVNGVRGTRTNFLSASTLEYKGDTYPLSSFLTFSQNALSKSAAYHYQVLAWADNGSSKTPYIAKFVQKNSFSSVYYCPYYPVYNLPNYVIADSLFDFFGQNVPVLHQVYIRIEDVHPLRNPNELMQIAKFLYAEHVPYMIAVIPIYKDNSVEVPLTDRPKVAKALRYMQAHGGSIVMHGDTHQYGPYQSGEAFEFWDPFTQGPIPDETSYVTGKLHQGLQILLQNGLYPIGFEPPHYAMTAHGYALLSQHFSTLVGQVQVTDNSFVTQAPPFIVYHSYESGLKIYPENGGYVYAEQPTVVPQLLSNVRQTFVVRDSMSGVFFHPYLPITYLKQLVIGLKALHVQFFNPRDLRNITRTPWGDITTGNGRLQEKISISPSPSSNVRRSYSVAFYISWAIVVVVGLALFGFFVVIIRIRKQRSAWLFEERAVNGGSDERE